MSSAINAPTTLKCRKYKYKYPNTSPEIFSLSQYESVLGEYTTIYINGYNFSKSNTTGNSTVTFGYITNIPVTFFSSVIISFVVPVINITTGTYDIQVINNNYPTSLYSNKISYTLL